MATSLLLVACNSRPIGGKLSDTAWTLTAMQVGKKPVPLPAGMKVSLAFAEDPNGTGRLNGTAPCNRYFAEYTATGATLRLGDIGATKRHCDQMDLENAYFGLLSKATGYSVRKGRLEVACEGGLLTFARMSDADADAVRRKEALGKLTAQFPPIDAGEALHLYPIVRVDSPGNYPFLGTLVDTAYYRLFDETVREVWSGSGGDVMAVGQYGGFFICRVPGRYVSSDIALFRLAAGELRRAETIAWAWCDEGWCNQQDAWLTDLDGDGRTDAVQRYALTDDSGRIREERLSALHQNERGELKPDASIKLNPKLYQMAKI